MHATCMYSLLTVCFYLVSLQLSLVSLVSSALCSLLSLNLFISVCFIYFLFPVSFRLFEIKPSLQDMFSFKSQDLTNNELLEKHAVSVMETIDTALNLIKENEIETLVSTLIELGIAHSMNKVTPKHFAVRIFAISPIHNCMVCMSTNQ